MQAPCLPHICLNLQVKQTLMSWTEAANNQQLQPFLRNKLAQVVVLVLRVRSWGCTLACNSCRLKDLSALDIAVQPHCHTI